MNPIPMMLDLVCISLAAAVGACCRFVLTVLLGRTKQGFDLGTLASNVIGGGILGFALGLSQLMTFDGFQAVAVGFCGGLTTFSTFAMNVVHAMLKRKPLLAGGEIILNTSLTILVAALGTLVGKGF